MWARKSTDNGVTWLADMAFSDVVTPLPLQPDPGIVSIYVGDYDYGSSLLNQHLSAWADGRVIISGISQQDAFHDREPISPGGSPTPTPTPTATPTPGPITLSASGRKVGGVNTADLSWSPVTSTNIDVYRNGVVVATVPNTGAYTDSTGAHGRATYTYRVCEAGTQTCSNDATVSFGGGH